MPFFLVRAKGRTEWLVVNAKDTGHNCDFDTVTAAQNAAGKPFDDALLFRFVTGE